MAALSWESVWQIKSSLALGVSAWGTALTLAITMGGMSLGALTAGRILNARPEPERPLRLYGILEAVIGIAGLFLIPAFAAVERLDTYAYAHMPQMGSLVHIAGIVAVLGLPAFCMGATLPVLGLMARRYNSSIALLYGLNTIGAAAGVLLTALVIIPALGIAHTIWLIALVNMAVGLTAWLIRLPEAAQAESTAHHAPEKTLLPPLPLKQAAPVVFVSGFAIFLLEVAWFRSLTAAFTSSTEAFAIMLSCVLLALGAGGAAVPFLRRNSVCLGKLVASAGILILLMTPVIERFDLMVQTNTEFPAALFLQWFGLTLYVTGAPVLLLGTALPWILEEQTRPARWGVLYGLNAFAAIAGAVSAAWIFLPWIGFARTAWMAGAIVAVAGLFLLPRRRSKAVFAALSIVALLAAILFESGVGRTRVQGASKFRHVTQNDIVAVHEGPDATISVVGYENDRRYLFIDGFVATGQSGADEQAFPEHYMLWMGHLPMLMHPAPENALVICFGTGQTANAVRRENPVTLDIVDINEGVFDLAHHFRANESVLEDPRVNPIIMDGRAYMRRTGKTYDVITLEPMPPTFAGVNSLYSREFYQLARDHMSAQGIIAQWLPFHLVAPAYSASIARTFQDVFPNAVLWVDPQSKTGILLGSKSDTIDLATSLPGYERLKIERSLSREEARDAILLDREKLRAYGLYGEIITDNHQLLAYGEAPHLNRLRPAENNRANFELLETITRSTGN
jgi:spermidine synthase